MVKVLATGTFDILHPGHLAYLREAKRLGDELYVIVSNSATVEHKPKPLLPDEQRLEMVAAIKDVDHAVLGDEKDMFKPLEAIKPDIIALGFDQHFSEDKLESQLQDHGIFAKVVRVNARRGEHFCDTSAIMNRILEKAVR
ncbi:MAG: FAD synthase [Methanosarcinales archaeon]|nr:FAD synthase [Methanosarcinales archaeon]